MLSPNHPAVAPLPGEKPTPPDEVQIILIRVARRIRAGWCQQTLYYPDEGVPDRFCLLGALAFETNRMGMPHAVFIRGEAYERLKKACGMAPDRWNDMPGRTADEVVELVLRCAYDL